MNINTSNYWSASSASSNGFSGLVSGMDTESMVEKMLSGTQSKIDAQKALKQQITWKQTMYRDIIKSINDFRTKYFNNSFDATSNMNFASNAFFNTMKASLISGSGVKVISADSSALTGDMKVKVQQLATAAQLKCYESYKVSNDSVTGEAVDMDALREALDKTMTIKIGSEDAGTSVDIDLTGASTAQEIADKINDTLTQQKVTDITAKVVDGKLVISDSKKQISGIETSTLAGKMTGLTTSETAEDGTITAQAEMEPKSGLSFDVTLDGVQKNITLDNVVGTGSNGEITLDDVVTAINKKLDLAFGKDVIKAEQTNGALKFSFGTIAGEKGHSFRMTGVDLNQLGITPGSSSNVSLSTKLGDLNNVSGGIYEFTINGEKFSFDSDTTVGELINEVNASGAGVKISYSSLADQFTMESASTGKNYSIEIEQTTGNILSAMFGPQVVRAGGQMATDRLTVGTIDGEGVADDAKIKEGTIKFSVNGTSYTFSLPRKKENEMYSRDEFEEEFNKYLEDNFGAGSITYDAETGDFTTEPGFELSITEVSLMGEKDKIDLKLDGKNNLATANTKISDINNFTDDEKAALEALAGGNGTLGDLNATGADGKDADGVSFDTESGRLYVTKDGASAITNAGSGLSNGTLFGGVSFGNGKIADGRLQSGQDAIVNINGVETTRSSNTFTIDGITMEITDVHKDDEQAVIGTVRDVDTIVEGFESFVKDYNAMLDKLYGYTDAKAEYRDYAPLTDAQKKEMSDREIELWEEKAKTGLLRRDMDVEHFLSQMRIAMYEKPAGGKFAMYDIGLETGQYTDKGKLNLDTTKLRNALAQDPASVEQLFMDIEDGLSGKLIDIMKDTANPSSGSPGSLVKLAGIEGYASDENNSLSQQLKEIEERIKDLEDRYEKEKTRYWNQFNTMEQVLANFNSQSSMIQSQFMAY